MEEGFVPVEKGMRITGHKDAKSYEKYNMCSPDSNQRAMQDLISGEPLLTAWKASTYQELVHG
jgi:hypothetical protein